MMSDQQAQELPISSPMKMPHVVAAVREGLLSAEEGEALAEALRAMDPCDEKGRNPAIAQWIAAREFFAASQVERPDEGLRRPLIQHHPHDVEWLARVREDHEESLREEQAIEDDLLSQERFESNAERAGAHKGFKIGLAAARLPERPDGDCPYCRGTGRSGDEGQWGCRRCGGSGRLPERPDEDRWLMQTKTGGGGVPVEERGDCVPACIASVLGLPIDAISNTHGDGWWDRLQAEVAKHEYCIAVLDTKLEPPPGYWIASVPSLNLPMEPDGRQPWHCVVARGYELVHDPCIAANRYDVETWAKALDNLAEGWVLTPLDPAARLPVTPEREDRP